MADNSSLFVANPVGLDISRSKFDLSHTWSGTFNAGQLIPTLAYSDVLVGDTFKVSADIVIRSTTPIAPVMDQAYCDIYYFFVPHKMVLSRESMSTATTDGVHSFEAFLGAQDSLLNMPLPSNATLPTVRLKNAVSDGDFVHSFCDYIGVNGKGLSAYIDITPFEALAYAKVWNDYFREPNTMAPISFTISGGSILFYGGATGLLGSNNINSNAVQDNIIQPVCRYHGYFGSCLPWPQRNSTTVTMPLGDRAAIKIIPASELTGQDGQDQSPIFVRRHGGNPPVYVDAEGGSILSNGTNLVDTSDHVAFINPNGSLYADLRTATAASVNSFRLAVQTQRWYEALARGGNRLANMAQLFGVTPHDVGSDVPEYLGGLHIPLSITQVANTAGTTYSTATQQAIGSTGAFSLSSDGSYICTKSFDTWGTIISVMCIRPHESFNQGIHRRFFRKNRLDYYWPQFANLGEQAVLSREIYADGTADDENVFGYQEAWAEYRMLPDVVTGYLRPNLSGNIGYWSYTNNFGSRPTLAGYLNAGNVKDLFDRTLQVSSGTAGFQFEAQITHHIIAIRPMPTYSIPGLVDHH